jgi:hypothetical protein
MRDLITESARHYRNQIVGVSTKNSKRRISNFVMSVSVRSQVSNPKYGTYLYYIRYGTPAINSVEPL